MELFGLAFHAGGLEVFGGLLDVLDAFLFLADAARGNIGG